MPRRWEGSVRAIGSAPGRIDGIEAVYGPVSQELAAIARQTTGAHWPPPARRPAPGPRRKETEFTPSAARSTRRCARRRGLTLVPGAGSRRTAVLGRQRRRNRSSAFAPARNPRNGRRAQAPRHATGAALGLRQSSRRGKRPAVSSPVKCAMQPSGSLNRRMATKRGCSPMSNQRRVPAGTEIRSFFSHSTT